jgi:hypothetical protein
MEPRCGCELEGCGEIGCEGIPEPGSDFCADCLEGEHL